MELSLRLILEKSLTEGLDTYLAFMDLEKSFDNVNWSRLFTSLRKIEVKYKKWNYWNFHKSQKIIVTIEEEGIEEYITERI